MRQKQKLPQKVRSEAGMWRQGLSRRLKIRQSTAPSGNAKYGQAAEDIERVLGPVIVVLHAVNSKRDNPHTDIGYRVDEEEA